MRTKSSNEIPQLPRRKTVNMLLVGYSCNDRFQQECQTLTKVFIKLTQLTANDLSKLTLEFCYKCVEIMN